MADSPSDHYSPRGQHPAPEDDAYDIHDYRSPQPQQLSSHHYHNSYAAPAPAPAHPHPSPPPVQSRPSPQQTATSPRTRKDRESEEKKKQNKVAEARSHAAQLSRLGPYGTVTEPTAVSSRLPPLKDNKDVTLPPHEGARRHEGHHAAVIGSEHGSPQPLQ